MKVSIVSLMLVIAINHSAAQVQFGTVGPSLSVGFGTVNVPSFGIAPGVSVQPGPYPFVPEVTIGYSGAGESD